MEEDHFWLGSKREDGSEDCPRLQMAHSQDHEYIPGVLKFPDPLKDSLTFKYHNPTEQVFDTDIWEVFQIQTRAHCYLLKYVGDY